MKHQFLSQLRSDTCYPSFRSFVGVFKVFGYLAAIGVLVACLMSSNMTAIILGFVAAPLIVLVVMAIAEASSMLADIADATLDAAFQQSVNEEVPDDHAARTGGSAEVDVSAFAARARSGGYTHS